MSAPRQEPANFSASRAALYLTKRRQDVTDLARAGEFEGAWRTSRGHWRIPRVSLDAYLDAERERAQASDSIYARGLRAVG